MAYATRGLVPQYLHRRTASRLSIDADGLRYETLFAQMQVFWDEVEQIDVGLFGHVRLHTHRELRVPPVLDTCLVSKVRTTIPISNFGDIHGSGALAEALHAWAPHLIPPRKAS